MVFVPYLLYILLTVIVMFIVLALMDSIEFVRKRPYIRVIVKVIFSIIIISFILPIVTILLRPILN